MVALETYSINEQSDWGLVIGLGVFAVQAIVENDYSRIKAGVVSFFAFGVLELIALVRYPFALSWEQPIGWLYVFFIVSILLVGLYMCTNCLSYPHE